MASKIENTPGRLKRQLRKAADAATLESLGRFFKGPVRALGVRTPEVRRIASAAAKEYRAARMDVIDVFDIAEALWRGEMLEERVLAVFLVARFQRGLQPVHWNRLEAWAASLSNWGETDALAIYLVGPFLDRHRDSIRHLGAWCESENPFQRRAAAVSLVPLARRGEVEESVLRVSDALAGDGDDLVQKGVGWLLKELSRKRPDAVVHYLMQRRSILSRLTLRYASEKLPEASKRRVRERS